jgi:hypothetical protein
VSRIIRLSATLALPARGPVPGLARWPEIPARGATTSQSASCWNAFAPPAAPFRYGQASYRRRRAFSLEGQISDLVNAAYGPTPRRTAPHAKDPPPRMPLPAPDGLTISDPPGLKESGE